MRNENLRVAYQKYPVGYAFYEILEDNVGRVTDFIVLDINNIFLQITGMTKEETLHKPLSSVKMTLKHPEVYNLHNIKEVALTGAKRVTHYFSEQKKMWFKVYIYSNDEKYFATAFFPEPDNVDLPKPFTNKAIK